jgi:hypothetical protein
MRWSFACLGSSRASQSLKFKRLPSSLTSSEIRKANGRRGRTFANGSGLSGNRRKNVSMQRSRLPGRIHALKYLESTTAGLVRLDWKIWMKARKTTSAKGTIFPGPNSSQTLSGVQITHSRTDSTRESLHRGASLRVFILDQHIFAERRISAESPWRSKVAAQLRFLLPGAGHGPSIRFKTPPSCQEILACELWT